MGKPNQCTEQVATKVLFKTSKTTLRSCSRTCSYISHLNQCDIIHMKKIQSKTYIHGGKLKRDFSVETNHCVWRRYGRRIREKEAGSLKTKISCAPYETCTRKLFLSAGEDIKDVTSAADFLWRNVSKLTRTIQENKLRIPYQTSNQIFNIHERAASILPELNYFDNNNGMSDENKSFKEESKHSIRQKKVKIKKSNVYSKTRQNRYFPGSSYRNKAKKETFKGIKEPNRLDFVRHLEKIVQYFANCKNNGNNINLNISINLTPATERTTENKCTYTDDENIFETYANQKISYDVNLNDGYMVTTLKEKQSLIENVAAIKKNSSHSKPDIIPILNNADSQINYNSSSAFNSDEKSDESEKVAEDIIKKYNFERSTMTTELEIAIEINALKEVLRDLTKTAALLINNHKTNSKKESKIVKSNSEKKILHNPIVVANKYNIVHANTTQHDADQTKVTQLSIHSRVNSGLTLKEEQRKKECFKRNSKNCASYQVIESERVLKVTDMTSAMDIDKERVTDEASTCCVPRSISLFEVPVQKNNQNLIAFFCDGFTKKPDYVYDVCSRKSPEMKKSLTHPTEPQGCSPVVFGDIRCKRVSDSVYVDVGNDRNFPKVSLRKCTNFNKFVYCFVLLIVVLVLGCLLYVYFTKDRSFIINALNKFPNYQRKISQLVGLPKENIPELGF